MIRTPTFFHQICSDFLYPFSGRTINNGSFTRLRRQVVFQQLMHNIKLGCWCGLHHYEVQIVPLRSTVKTEQFDADSFAEMREYVGHHFRLGGRGEAQHRRHVVCPRPFLDEAPDVTVIGAEVMTPFG